MCRWLAYSGNPIALDDLILETEHSLIDQSLSARRSESPTNGDGFGIGWYGEGETPGLYRDTHPAWNDENLRDLGAHIHSRMFLAHVRRATGTSVQRSNCHPFRHGRWLFVHNGLIEEFSRIKRSLVLEVAPELFPLIRGTTDSEILFHLALTFGLADDAIPALERMAGLVEQVALAEGVDDALQMTLGLSDGERLIAVRYASRGPARSLFVSKSVAALRALEPRNPRLAGVSEESRVIVSEPLTELLDSWQELPAATAIVVERGRVHQQPFSPRYSE